MFAAFRRGLCASAVLGTVAFLSAVACSSGQETSGEERAPREDSGLPSASAQLDSLGRATVRFSSRGRDLAPVRSAAEAEISLRLGMSLPMTADGRLELRPEATPTRSLALSPVLATRAAATLGADGSAVYEGAFGSADLVQSASLDTLRTQIALRDAKSPDLFVWRADLGEGLRARARDDLGVDLIDEQGATYLAVSPALITDAAGRTRSVPLLFEADGHVRLRVDHRELAYPALIDFSVALGGGVRALAIQPTQIKGRVMVLLDTSGSMIWQFGSSTGTHGDSPRDGRALRCDNNMPGSTFSCTQNVPCTAANGAGAYWPVDNAAQPSRMLASKLAMQNVINAYSGILDFGLERYAEDGSCANSLYCCNPQTNGTTRGMCADVGEYTDVANSGTGNDLSYSGGCGTASVGGRVLVTPGPTSGAELLPWVDFVEDFCSSTAAVGGKPRNPELRGDGSTPLARSIITARESWYRPIYNDSRQAGTQALDDPLIDCRPYVLVVMTDGDDTCSVAPFDCQGNNANCGPGQRCVDVDLDDNDETWRCACSSTSQCGSSQDDCIADPRTVDCNDSDAQCASNDCVDTPGNNDNFRCACANNADCGTGMTCVTAGAPEVDCRNDDSRCLSGNCYDLPNTAGTNWRCACNGDAQCPATQRCSNGRCVTRGVCQAAGRCDRFFEPRPRAQVTTLTGVNTVNPVKTYVLGMGNPAGLNQTELNAMAVAGGTTQARLASSQAEIEAAFADIVANTVKYEVCNKADDNCNARVDEGLGVYQECATTADCNGGACDLGRCVCNGPAQCGSGYTCSNEAPTRFCRPSCSEGQGACLVNGVRKCGVGVGQCCVNDASDTCTDITPPAGSPEVCNGIDDNCNGFIDENLSCQGCVPLPEVCDGKDNDCDGKIDEPGVGGLVDAGGPCGSSVGRCSPGTAACSNGTLVCSGATGPFPEVCNGYDDDCDGVTDGMTRECYTGPAGTKDVGACHGGTQACAVTTPGAERWGTCTGQQLPTNEICNGIDDDCDGVIDDGIPSSQPGEATGDACCSDKAPGSKCGQGQCHKGTWVCAGSLVVCDNAGSPSNETCDNQDNDCDGQVDNIPGLGGPCVAPGGCGGVLKCDSDEQKLVCEPTGSTGVEVCNGLDDDCDGKTDEIEDIRVNDDWWGDDCDAPPSGHQQLPCKPGTFVCKNGEQVCEGAVGPLPEVCDLKDTDCDGVADTLAACPGTNACVQGVCVEPCHGGEFPCPGGYECQPFGDKKYCVPNTCNNVECPPGATCQGGACTLDNQGGAGNEAGAPSGNEAGAATSSEGGASASEGGEGNEPGSDTGGSGNAGKTGSGATGNQSGGLEARGNYGLVTGGGGCACRTAPREGGKWAALAGLLLVGAASRRRRSGERRASR